MAGNNNSGLMNFTKTILLPILIALIIYLILFHALLPLYRHHRARYAQYLPLNTTLPTSLRPSHLRSRFSFLRILLPSTWFSMGYDNNRSSSHSNSISRHRLSRNAIPSTISEGGDLDSNSNSDDDEESTRFSDEHGEAMIGFSLQPQPHTLSLSSIADANRRRRDGMDRQVARGILAAREMNATEHESTNTNMNGSLNPNALPAANVYTDPPPEHRLSRELEEVFRDDSDDENDEEANGRGVTVGRRSLSVSR